MAQRIKILSTEFQPKNEYVLVKPEELKTEETILPSGIIKLGEELKSTDRPTSGVVVDAGCECEDITQGDFIIWPNTDGLDLTFNDGEFMLLRFASVIGSKKRV